MENKALYAWILVVRLVTVMDGYSEEQEGE